MDLHIFNPEHDMVLAYAGKHLNCSHTVQELRMNLGWLPALWARDGDVVLVDDAAFAVKAATKTKLPKADVLFLQVEDIKGQRFDCIHPWGWDAALRTMLIANRISSPSIPDDNRLACIRRLSSRQLTTEALPFLRRGIEDVTCGRSVFVDGSSTDGIAEAMESLRDISASFVLKSPWSSSGRGIRYVDGGGADGNTTRWITNTMHRQGGIMVEPYYKKVRDLAMEFDMKDGTAVYRGLSLFLTRNGSYTGNLITTEEQKQKHLSTYIPPALLKEVRERICNFANRRLGGIYEGPFGVDMMIVAAGKFLLHPCVEINLRRTMGHAALSLPASDALPDRVMTITHDVNYRLKVRPIGNNFVQIL